MDGKTKITVLKDDGYMSLQADGHHKDQIVCSAISAIMQTAELGLKAIAESYNGVIIVEVEDCFQD